MVRPALSTRVEGARVVATRYSKKLKKFTPIIDLMVFSLDFSTIINYLYCTKYKVVYYGSQTEFQHS